MGTRDEVIKFTDIAMQELQSFTQNMDMAALEQAKALILEAETAHHRVHVTAGRTIWRLSLFSTRRLAWCAP